MIEKIKNEVKLLIGKNNNGHGFDHVERVYKTALCFAEKEQAGLQVVALASLLHDVDDYKIFGEESALKLFNAKRILKDYHYNDETIDRVCNIIQSMGYSRYLKGIRPQTLEGKIVSDADMLDAMGAQGIVRAISYAVSSGSNVIFNRDIFPEKHLSAQSYTDKIRKEDTCINHFFYKLLKLKNLMLTKSGYKEACVRHKIMVDFLKAYFEEQKCNDWLEYLEVYEADNSQVPLNIYRIA